MSPRNKKTTQPVEEPEGTGEAVAPPPSEAVPAAPETVPATGDDVWSVWLPSPEANVEIRWQVVEAARGEARFPVQVLSVADLAAAPSATYRRLRGIVLTPRHPEPRRRVAELMVQATLSPEQPEVPFSLHASLDPRPVFRGVLQAEYRQGDPARLVVRDLVYTGGHVAVKVLHPSPAAGVTAADE